MVKIGWLQQNINIKGGAEMSCSALRENAPSGVEIVHCPARYRPPRDVDVFVIQNSTDYSAQWIQELALKKVVRHVRDPWFAGDAQLRRWLLDNADLLLFSSELQRNDIQERYGFDRPSKCIPVPVRLKPFKEAAQDERRGSVFVGRCDVYKGASEAVNWALRTGEELALIGDNKYMHFGSLPPYIKFMGLVPYAQMPSILGKAARLVTFPNWTEAFGRSVVEAWAAGCEIVANERVGAVEWIRDAPKRLGYAGPISEFWDAVMEVSDG
jgi:glycosyltransferase involved in cell wall biosynthesis